VTPDLQPPRPGRSMLKRAALASVAIVLMSAGAVSAAGFLAIDDVINEFEAARDGRELPEIPDIDRADAGDARTIMVLGSDARYGDEKLGIPPRADTIILARLDPDKDAITLMSIPRDLRVEIPGHGGDRINAAYSAGGANLVVKTVKRLLSRSGKPFKINHVIQVDFAGFRRGIDYLGCVYVDVDRRYFNDRGGPGGYATIDIQPGYQKLCGRDSLDYVRYRHEDNDIVRGARQQDFLRQLKGQDAVRAKLKLENRGEIVKILGRYTDPDKAILKKKTLLSLLKLGIFVSDKPIQEVPFGDGRLQEDGHYLIASEGAIRETVEDFMNARDLSTPRGELEPTEEQKEAAEKREKKSKAREAAIPGLEIAEKDGQDKAIVAAAKLKKKLPFYFPRLRMIGSRYEGDARVYKIRDGKGKWRRAYRIVLRKGTVGEYYGVQGMTWKAPPILDGPHDTIERNGRTLRVYYDGRRVRLVAWRTDNGVYYVHNTLLRTIPKRQMIEIAASLTRLGAK
jgi:LCP family protein required for cell wall assembly